MASIGRLDLPNKRDDLAVAVREMLRPALHQRNVEVVGWCYVSAYLAGERGVIADWNSGKVEVEPGWEDDEGNLRLRWEEVLTKTMTEEGRLAALDTSPVAKKRANSLESLRSGSTGQAVLDYAMSADQESLFKARLMGGLVQYGTYGQAAWGLDSEREEDLLRVRRELIPPWQLMGVPAKTVCHNDTDALARVRLIRRSYLHSRAGFKVPSDTAEADLEPVKVRKGVDANGLWGLGDGDLVFGDLFDRSGDMAPKGGTPRDLEKARTQNAQTGVDDFYRLKEVFEVGEDNTVSRYVALVGKVIVQDVDFWGKGIRVPMPIGVSRYQDTGSFYGRGFVGRLMPMALELERFLEKLVEHAGDMDRFAFVMIPNTLGITRESMENTGWPKYMFYEPDYAAEKLGVETFQPGQPTDVPAKLFQFGVGVLDRSAAQGPLYAGMPPGRFDSGSGIQTLQNIGATHLVSTAEGLEASYVTVFRSVLFQIRERMQNKGTGTVSIDLARVRNSIAGVELDATTGQMRLSLGKIPDPWAIELHIGSKDPSQRERERGEALQLNQLGKLSDLELVILNYQRGWGLPLGQVDKWENYVKGSLLNLLMFGDGNEPYLTENTEQTPIVDKLVDDVFVQLFAVKEFVSGTEFRMASKKVRAGFQFRIEELRMMAGMQLPRQAPSLEMMGAMAGQNGQQGPNGMGLGGRR